MKPIDRESNHTVALRTPEYFYPSLRLRHQLKGHTNSIYQMSLTLSGHLLATPSEDNTVKIWDIQTGELLQTIEHRPAPRCVSWSPNGELLAIGQGIGSGKITLWEYKKKGVLYNLLGHDLPINNLAWSPDSISLASCSDDGSIQIWDTRNNKRLFELKGKRSVYSLAWSPDGKYLCSCSWEKNITMWVIQTGKEHYSIGGHESDINCIAFAPGKDSQYFASGSDDLTVRIWETETGRQKYVLEGHTDKIVSVSFIDSGHLLISMDYKGNAIIWRTDNWSNVINFDNIGKLGIFPKLAVHPTLPIIAFISREEFIIKVWDIDFNLLRTTDDSISTFYYVNAKVVLLGDSGVGKSGLGIRIAEKEFRKTESTHGAQFWHFPIQDLPFLPPNIQAELTLWDLAGQPEYRLTHQLFLDDMDATLLLFDCSDSNDPFRGVPYWAKVLRKHAPKHALKYLVSSRCDVSSITVDRREINHELAKYKLDEYFKTSAKNGDGVEELLKSLIKNIPWEELPRTSTPQLFQVVRKYLMDCKNSGTTIIPLEKIHQTVQKRLKKRPATINEIEAVVKLLQSRGLVFRIDLRPGSTFVLLKPELVNQYGASIIQAARNHPLGIGAVPERDVLTGSIIFSGFARLPQSQEALILDATTELLIHHDLCFREMGYLVFPSQINVTRLPPSEALPRTEVAYRFSGSIETIYASLVVKLSYTDYFRREDQWKYAVEFTRDGFHLGFSMHQVEEGTGELDIYFYPGISEFDRVTFIRFVTDHLMAKGINIQEQIRLYCAKCSKEVTNREAIETRIREGSLEIPCQYCTTTILIPKSIEERYSRDPALSEKQTKLVEIVEERTKEEVKQFLVDKQQYKLQEDDQLHILHISDLHIRNDNKASTYRIQLEADIRKELGIRRLDYIVISGDIANHSTEEEYRIAFTFLDRLVKQFGLDSSRVIIVPGNHDQNWVLSKKAYPFVYKDDQPSILPEGRYIPAGDSGVLLRDDRLYTDRFNYFNTFFYRKIYGGQEFSQDFTDQYLLVERPDDRILFLGLNTSWQVDHHFKTRAAAYMPALTRALDKIIEEKYDNWLKIAVFHHPVRGKESINDDFMQLLTVNGFQICLHGHIHEASNGYFKYDDPRGISIIGAGTFGASTVDQVFGIPLQYNLMTLDKKTGELIVQTRKKEKPDGAWSADARWGNKNKPQPWYSLQIKNYKTEIKK